MVADEFHERIRDTRLVWLDECGHAPMIEHPEPFASHLRSFLNELDSLENGRENGLESGDDDRQEVA